LRQIQLQGTQGGFGIYSLSLKRDFNNKRGSIGFGAENFFTPRFKIKNELNSQVINQNSTTVIHNMNFKINFSYRIGKLTNNDQPKRRRRSVSNDDLKDGGGDNGGGGMQGAGAPAGGGGQGGAAPQGGAGQYQKGQAPGQSKGQAPVPQGQQGQWNNQKPAEQKEEAKPIDKSEEQKRDSVTDEEKTPSDSIQKNDAIPVAPQEQKQDSTQTTK